MNIITISGLDGSGKSTQVKLLKKYLESRGKRVFYFHAVDFSIGNKMTKMFHFCHPERAKRAEGSRPNGASDNFTGFFTPSHSVQNDNNKPKSVTRANWLQIQLRKIALWIDIWRFKKLVKKLEKQNYDYILSDRFFYDSVVNIEYLERISPPPLPGEPACRRGRELEEGAPSPPAKTAGRQPSPKGRGGLKMPQPNLAIYIQANPQNIMNRERVPDQGLEYLQKKKELYDAKIKEFNFTVVNGDRNKEEVFEEIKNLCQDSIS